MISEQLFGDEFCEYFLSHLSTTGHTYIWPYHQEPSAESNNLDRHDLPLVKDHKCTRIFS